MKKNESSLVQMARYNCWANERMQNMILKLEKEGWEAEVNSSFKSLRETVLHIWDAEVVWNKRMKGESLKDWPSKGQTASREEILAQWGVFNKEVIDYALSLSQDHWDQDVKYSTISDKNKQQNTREFMFRHCMNHSTYHRGQLITLLRQLGLSEILSTDLLVYGREN